MPFWRRKPLHQRLAEQGGLVERPRHELLWGEGGIHGPQRPRQWDAVATTQVHGLHGDELEFVTLPDGRTVPSLAAPLAAAVSLEPPYRARAVRSAGDLWAIGVRRIEVRELPGEEGDELEHVEEDVVLLGRRLDGDFWEVEETEL